MSQKYAPCIDWFSDDIDAKASDRNLEDMVDMESIQDVYNKLYIVIMFGLFYWSLANEHPNLSQLQRREFKGYAVARGKDQKETLALMRGELLIETSHTKGVDPPFYELFKSVLDSGDAVNY